MTSSRNTAFRVDFRVARVCRQRVAPEVRTWSGLGHLQGERAEDFREAMFEKSLALAGGAACLQARFPER